MRGCPTLRNSLLILALAALSFVWGCGSSERTAARTTAAPSLKEFLSTSERTFRPADYDPPVETLKTENRAFTEATPSPGFTAPVAAETTAGFRVQVLLTQDIDRAGATRDTLATEIPDEWVYLTFDLPYYKVRVGNYLDRESAGRSVQRLVALGYADAWVVPDKVLRNPPPPPLRAAPPDTTSH